MKEGTHNAAFAPAVFISADWSKDPRKRSVHVADLRRRRIWRVQNSDWHLETVLDLARQLRREGSVLVGLDLALGVPAGYWAAVKKVPRWRGCGSFIEWLGQVGDSQEFFARVRDAESWRVGRPFFHVPKGVGTLTAFKETVPGGLLRRIDRCTAAKGMFVVSGIPGTVGSGTRALWRELIPALERGRDFRVWPFEGEMEKLFAEGQIVLAETYPGLAYAAALAEALPTRRISIAKTKSGPRGRACELLEQARWVRNGGVEIGDLAPARADEDAFDSHLTAAAVLRCVVEGAPLFDPSWVDAEAEGSMLLAGPVDPARPAKKLKVEAAEAELPLDAPSPRSRARRSSKRPRRVGRKSRPVESGQSREYRCPLPGCDKVFYGSRGGWDGHVGSLRKHPDWQPEIVEPKRRRQLFKAEYGSWFH